MVQANGLTPCGQGDFAPNIFDAEVCTKGVYEAYFTLPVRCQLFFGNIFIQRDVERVFLTNFFLILMNIAHLIRYPPFCIIKV